MIVSSGNLAEQYDGAVIRQSATMITETTGPASLLLGNRKAAEAYLLGSSYTAAEASMLNALAMAFDTLAASAAAPPLVPLGAGFTTAASAIRQLMPASYLSVKIMGE
jgi:hypothetical protein